MKEMQVALTDFFKNLGKVKIGFLVSCFFVVVLLITAIFVSHVAILVLVVISMLCAVVTSLVLIKEERANFRTMIELMKEQHIQEKRDSNELIESEDLNPFTERERAYINHRNKMFRTGVLLRIFLLCLVILLLYFMFS